jgi:formylglycine-generating enzyme required for sulfatase activity
MPNNPSVARGDRVGVTVNELHPVENVTWKQCNEYCRRLALRLPTQDEWEFGARSIGRAEFGDCERIECLEARENLADLTHFELIGRPVPKRVEWKDGYALHAPIGSFRANGFGLHDMLGNVSEWCSDRYFRQRVSSVATLSRASDNSDQRRVHRGGSWQEGAREASCRLFRGVFADGAMPTIGLRLARSIEP